MLLAGSLEAEFNNGICHTGWLTACEQEHLLLFTNFMAFTIAELRFQATGQQHRGCIIPQAVTQSLALLEMGVIIARNMLS